jgi:hypothetical protein
MKLTVNGVARFVPVRPFIVALFSQIGSTEDFLFVFVLVWLACILSFLLGLPSLGSLVAFSAAMSIATIGLYISYGTQFRLPKCPSPFGRIILSLTGIPIALRVIYADRFTRGPFHLGRFSYPSQSPPCSGLPLCRLSFASRSSTPSTPKHLTTRPSQSGSSLPTPWASGLKAPGGGSQDLSSRMQVRPLSASFVG